MGDQRAAAAVSTIDTANSRAVGGQDKARRALPRPGQAMEGTACNGARVRRGKRKRSTLLDGGSVRRKEKAGSRQAEAGVGGAGASSDASKVCSNALSAPRARDSLIEAWRNCRKKNAMRSSVNLALRPVTAMAPSH